MPDLQDQTPNDLSIQKGMFNINEAIWVAYILFKIWN